MSGFNLSELMPFYLDETDEQIAALNGALLRLEQTPDDAGALHEAFRIFHTIKGSSIVLGLEGVNALTHHLESLFDQIRAGKRTLDLPALQLCFRCLDELRDYHKHLRAEGHSNIDLSGLTASVLAYLDETGTGAAPATQPVEKPSSEPPATEPGPLPEQEPPVAAPEPEAPTAFSEFSRRNRVGLTVIFVPNLPWPDMKAKLVLNRLAARAPVLETEPPVEQLDEVAELPRFTAWLSFEGDPEELRPLADVDGVAEIVVHTSEEKPRAAVQPEVAAVREPRAPAAAAPSPTPALSSKKTRMAETIRVDSDRLDHLMNLAGELVINKARFFQIAGGLDELFRGSNAVLLASDTQDRLDSLARALDGSNGQAAATLERCGTQFRRLRENFRAIQGELDLIRQGREQLKVLSDAIHQLARVTDGIQRGVLETRMVPIGPLFERFRRVIRDLSLSSGKEVKLQLDGEKTELDKRMIDELSDPLIHLVRNAVDHGLETPEQRAANGKPRAGQVTLQAAHRGNSVVITVSDDGRGIDCGRIRSKLIGKGILSESKVNELSERELIAFIFHPGLSTAETITEISGRGVGMDIVKSRIESLNGSVDVRTTPGRGTVFSIRLPLTLAILSTLLVRIFEEVYAIPLDHIDEIVEVTPARAFRVHDQRMIDIRGRLVALVALNDVFRWGGADHPALADRDPAAPVSGKMTVVVVQNGETTIGLVVDELIGMQPVVLKSIERNFRPIQGISGASILGDGRVSLILDVDALIGTVSLDATGHLAGMAEAES